MDGGESLDFDRRPYNTLALPCECVIEKISHTAIVLGSLGLLSTSL